VLRDHPQVAAIGRLTLLQSFRCVRMVLWDESRRRLVSFGEIRSTRPGMVEMKTPHSTDTQSIQTEP
jgi:hypothetical protein